MKYSKGLNLANPLSAYAFESQKSQSKRPCIFLSHKSEDKPACRILAKYISDAGINYYLDENDLELQRASVEEKPILVTNCLKRGIQASSHMLVVLSEKTFSSQWIPFEVGFAHSELLGDDLNNSQKTFAAIFLKDIAEVITPDFLRVAYEIKDTTDFLLYLSFTVATSFKMFSFLKTENNIEIPNTEELSAILKR